jgi:hypothetical protein
MWNPDKATAIATQVLVEYLGVAAQFVVEDAMAMSKDANRSGNEYEELHMYTFLINLSNQLPPGLPAEQIRETIRKKYHRK